MPDSLDRLGRDVAQRLRRLGFRSPNRAAVDSLLSVAYMATMRTEEGRFVKGSLTFADPKTPVVDPPLLKRADFPAFTGFADPCPLTIDQVVKFSRAIDRWSGSIAVHTRRNGQLYAWGVVDQMVQTNIMEHRESQHGFFYPGALTVTMDGVGDISAFHGHIFLGGLKGHEVVLQEDTALESRMLFNFGFAAVEPYAEPIADALGSGRSVVDVLRLLIKTWQNCVGRLLINLRRFGTGGAFLLTPRPLLSAIKLGQTFPYRRLQDAFILGVLDFDYWELLSERGIEVMKQTESVPASLARECDLAKIDLEDRESELTSAVKLAASLAAVDGLVLMSPSLAVFGFGAKITASNRLPTIYDGAEYSRRGTRARVIDPARFGTRHGSMFRYCARDSRALGLVMSQDGHAKLIMSVGRNLVMWDNIKLLSHSDFSAGAVAREKSHRERKSAHAREPQRLGYTRMPKTIDSLMRHRQRLR